MNSTRAVSFKQSIILATHDKSTQSFLPPYAIALDLGRYLSLRGLGSHCRTEMGGSKSVDCGRVIECSCIVPSSASSSVIDLRREDSDQS